MAGYYFHFFVIIGRGGRGRRARGGRGGRAWGDRGRRARKNIAVPYGSDHYVWAGAAKTRVRIYPPGGTGHSSCTYDGLGSSSAPEHVKTRGGQIRTRVFAVYKNDFRDFRN